MRSRGRRTALDPNIALERQLLFTTDHGQALLVFTAAPGTEGHQKLQLLSVIGTQVLTR